MDHIKHLQIYHTAKVGLGRRYLNLITWLATGTKNGCQKASIETGESRRDDEEVNYSTNWILSILVRINQCFLLLPILNISHCWEWHFLHITAQLADYNAFSNCHTPPLEYKSKTSVTAHSIAAKMFSRLDIFRIMNTAANHIHGSWYIFSSQLFITDTICIINLWYYFEFISTCHVWDGKKVRLEITDALLVPILRSNMRQRSQQHFLIKVSINNLIMIFYMIDKQSNGFFFRQYHRVIGLSSLA